MKKFRFKFQALETVRKAQEDVALRSLAKAQELFREATELKSRLQSVLEESLIRRESLGVIAVESRDFRTEEDFIRGTKQRLVQSDQAIYRARKGVEKALRGYLHARRQTRMIEVLREKAYAEYRENVRKKEQRDLDDLYLMRSRMRQSPLGGVA